MKQNIFSDLFKALRTIFKSFGIPARCSESRTYNLAEDELFAAVKSAFEHLGWLAYTYRAGEGFHKLLRNSPMTWGEEFTVKLLPSGEICAESKARTEGIGFAMITDFGANQQNVDTFFAQVERELKAAEAKL